MKARKHLLGYLITAVLSSLVTGYAVVRAGANDLYKDALTEEVTSELVQNLNVLAWLKLEKEDKAVQALEASVNAAVHSCLASVSGDFDSLPIRLREALKVAKAYRQRFPYAYAEDKKAFEAIPNEPPLPRYCTDGVRALLGIQRVPPSETKSQD